MDNNDICKLNAINNSTGEVESIELLGGGAINRIENIEDKISNIINILHPVGSIYMSFDSTNPSTIFGGEWEQIKDRFIYAAGNKSVNTTGGEENHKLTISEMPSHAHSNLDQEDANGQGYLVQNPNNQYKSLVNRATNGKYYWWSNTLDTGSDAAHNNMPPYIVAYVWKRIK